MRDSGISGDRSSAGCFRALVAVLSLIGACVGVAHAQVVTEFSAGITASPRGITAGPDGNLWFTEASGDRIGRITPLGVVTEFSAGITAGARPQGITAGPDGNLWFTEPGGNRIGRINPTTQVITEFSTGLTPGATPFGITAGPDGNLWFAENFGLSSDRGIGRITPLGVITEFKTGISPGVNNVYITAGPDGNLWFTESFGQRIGRITPLGVVTEFSNTLGAAPYYITAGPDGNLWFTLPNIDRIGRITPLGVVTEFSAGITAGASPRGITTGSDGNLWFTENFGSPNPRIGRITPAGVVTEFATGIAAGMQPDGIVAGPDTNLWFVEANGNRIGRVSTGTTPAISLTFNGKLRDRVGQRESVPVNPDPDGKSDGTFTLLLPVSGLIIKKLEICQKSVPCQPLPADSSINRWDTVPGNGKWVIGVARALDSAALLNAPDGSIPSSSLFGSSTKIFISDILPNPSVFAAGSPFTLTATFFNDSTASATTVIGTTPVELFGLEVTQGIQDLQNSVPLVAGKRTFVRANVRAVDAGAVGALISGSLTARNLSNGSVFGTITNSNVGITIPLKLSPDRGILDDSLYFEIPVAWTQGNVEFEFGLNTGPLACSEPGGASDCKVAVNFQPRKPLTITFLGIAWTAAGVTHNNILGDVMTTIKEIKGLFPISDITFDLEGGTTTRNPCSASEFGSATTGNLVTDIQTIRNNECAAGTPCKQFYIALVADQSSCTNLVPPDLPLNGQALDIPSNNAVAFARRNGLGYLGPGCKGCFNPVMDSIARAHELSHASGNFHTASGAGEAGPNASYSPPGGYISPDPNPDGADTAYGFDVNNISGSRIYGPGTEDFMAYARPRWMSVYNYNRLFTIVGAPSSALGNFNSKAAVASAGELQVSATKVVLVRGGIVQSDAKLNPLYVTNTNGAIILPPPGSYAIRFADSLGNTLATYSFEPGKLTETDGFAFSLLLPWDIGARRIELLRNGLVIASRQASANVPVVTVTAPNGGESLSGASATFSWSATDTDADPLLYLVEYSRDAGATWRTLAIDWNSTNLPVDVTRLPGTTQALIRVTATDGFNSSQDQSDSIFTVGRHAPEAVILTPENNRLYVADQTVILQGLAYDMEDGSLTGGNLIWSSSLDGQIATGESPAINATTLQEGTHLITLTGRDSDAQTGAATLSIVIARTRPVLPATLSVNATGLFFKSYFGSGQSAAQRIAIRNSGDGGLTWSATADQPWIGVSPAGGATPANLDVTVDATGLSAGQYSGQITVTAAGAASSPQLIAVNLLIPPAVPPRIDIDGNNSYDALTDGLMIVRYLFGLSGAALTDGAIGPMATRTVPTDIVQFLDSIRTALDVDANGQSDALTDGLMLIRYLSGLRGAALTSGVVGSGATRSGAEIEQYIKVLMP